MRVCVRMCVCVRVKSILICDYTVVIEPELSSTALKVLRRKSVYLNSTLPRDTERLFNVTTVADCKFVC